LYGLVHHEHLFLGLSPSTGVNMDASKYEFLEANADTMFGRILSPHTEAKMFYARLQYSETTFFG
jgi:hypothetical protein